MCLSLVSFVNFIRRFYSVISVDLESVNSNCKSKIGELNVCKREISKLSEIVEERLNQVKASEDDLFTFKKRSQTLEKDLKLAQDELNDFTSNMSQ